MRRRSILLPLLLAIALYAVYWFVAQNPAVTESAGLEQKTVLEILLFLTALPLIFFAVRALDRILFDLIGSRRGAVRAPVILRELVSLLLYIILIATAISQVFDKNVVPLLAGGTVLAAIIGLAMQETLGNLFAGIALHIENSFVPGDVIKSGDFIGIVEAVRWRGTRLRTFNNAIVVVPNSMLARERLEVYPRNNLNARLLRIGVDYNVPPATVIDVLTQAATNVSGVAHELPCFARVADFGDSAVIYEIKYFTADFSMRDRIDADIRRAAWYALKRNGIPIPFPIRSLHRYSPPPQRYTPGEREIVALLSEVDILSPLSSEEHAAIAEDARVYIFAKGETIIRSGTAGESMFIVHDGIVSVRAEENEVAQLESGDFFGEMALLTGAARTADVVAATDAVVVEITKEALADVLQEHPELATAISSKIIERQGSLDSIHNARREEHGTVLSRIRAYFGL